MPAVVPPAVPAAVSPWITAPLDDGCSTSTEEPVANGANWVPLCPIIPAGVPANMCSFSLLRCHLDSISRSTRMCS